MPLHGPRRRLLTELLAFESGIDPRLHDFYRRNYEEPAMTSIAVERPGRCRRDLLTGELIVKRMTVREYFESLGVAAMFDVSGPECLPAMQYRSINGLGFFGYQFGESALTSLGLYQPPCVSVEEGGETLAVARHYIGVIPPAFWRNGRREGLYRSDRSAAPILATDVNTWQGTFTGRYAVTRYEDCLLPATQERLARALMRANLEAIAARVAGAGATLSEALDRRGVDESGVLAAAHLCGSGAVAGYLLEGLSMKDELGTTLEQYLFQFAELEVPALGTNCAVDEQGLA